MRLSRAFVALVAALLVAPAALITSQAGPADGERAQAPAPAAHASPRRPVDAKIEEIYRRAVQAAELSRDVERRALTLLRVAEAQARMGDRDASKETFRQAVAAAETLNLEDATDRPHILHWIAMAQAKAGFREEAVDSLRRLLRIAEAPVKDDQRKSGLFMNLVKSQAELRDEVGIRETLRMARQFYTTSKEEVIRTFAPESLVTLQAMSGDFAEALRMIHDPGLFRGIHAERRRHSALISIVRQITASDQETARPILEEAVRSVEADLTAILSRGVGFQDLNAIAEAQARLGRFDEALRTARSINTEDLPGKPDRSTRRGGLDSARFQEASAFALIGEEQAKAGKRDDAHRSAEEVVRIVATIQDDPYKGFPLERALQILAKVGDFAGALQIADTLKPDGRVDQYRIVATTQRESGDEPGARTTLETALRLVRERFDALKPKDPNRPLSGRSERNSLLAKIGRFQAMLGDLKGAIATIRRIDDDGLEIAALTALAQDRASVNDPDGALEAVGAINAPNSAAEALEAVLRSFPGRGAGAGRARSR